MGVKNDALAAVVVIGKAEKIYNSRQTSEEGEMAVGGMPKLSERGGGLDGHTATEKLLRAEGIRKGAETFPKIDRFLNRFQKKNLSLYLLNLMMILS